MIIYHHCKLSWSWHYSLLSESSLGTTNDACKHQGVRCQICSKKRYLGDILGIQLCSSWFSYKLLMKKNNYHIVTLPASERMIRAFLTLDDDRLIPWGQKFLILCKIRRTRGRIFRDAVHSFRILIIFQNHYLIFLIRCPLILIDMLFKESVVL